MFVSKKEFNELKKRFKALSESHNYLIDVVTKQEREIQELKKPKEPTYMA